MNDVFDSDLADDVAFRAMLSLPVLAVAIMVANVASLPLDLTPYAQRMRSDVVRQLFTLGYIAQLFSGAWLGVALFLDLPRAARVAMQAWLLSLCLVLAPVPTLRENVNAALVPLAVVLLVSLLVWTIAPSLKAQAGPVYAGSP